MANTKFKLGYGNETNINTAIAGEIIDGGDLVVTKDSHRFAFIDPKTQDVIFVKSKNPTFTSLEDAQNYAKTDTSAYAGEIIIVIVDEVMTTYQLKTADSGFDIVEFGTVTSADVKEVKSQIQEVQDMVDNALTITEF